MKAPTSKEKLSQMHEALDRELEQITAQPRSSSASRRDRQELRYSSNIDEPKRVPPKPSAFDHVVRETDIRTKKNQIGELQRKLMELQRKMDNISLSSGDDEGPIAREKNALAFREKEKQQPPNEDTARFLLEANKEKERNGKLLYSYPSLEDEEEEDEDSEDYAEMQRAIEKRKQQARENTGKRTINTKQPARVSQDPPTRTDPQRKVSTEVQSVLKPKYSNQKSNRLQKPSKLSQSQQKKSIRDSVASKKSQQKQPANPQLNRANSKRSVKSNHSNASNNSLNRSRQKSKNKHDSSFDRFSEKQQCLHNEEIGLARDLKKMGNLEREVAHYKRLAKKYKDQLEEYRVMEMELKELKKNFAKSQVIRTQQKKVIETLKSKITK